MLTPSSLSKDNIACGVYSPPKFRVNNHTLISCTSSTFVEILYNADNMCPLVWWYTLVFSIFVYPPQYTLFVPAIYFSNLHRNFCGLFLAFIVLCIEMKTFHRRLVVKNVLKFLVIRVACLARKFLLSQLSKTDTVGTEPNSSYYLKRERER